MTNATVSRVGQALGSGGTDALFLKVFAGEVLATFAKENIMMDKHVVRTIQYGFSAQFPVVGTATAAYHTAGTDILGQVVQHNERIVTIDDPLVSSVFIAKIDEAKNHYDVRSEYTREIGTILANTMDANIMQCGIIGARQVSGNIPGVTPAGTSLNAAGYGTTAATIAAGLSACAQALDEKNIPSTDRFAVFRPAQYWLLAAMLNTSSVMYSQVGGKGSYAEGVVPQISGLTLVKSNLLPNSNITTGPTNYRVDATNTRCLVFHRSGIATVKLMDLATEMWYDVSRQGTLVVARYAVGHNYLRPEACAELKTA